MGLILSEPMKEVVEILKILTKMSVEDAKNHPRAARRSGRPEGGYFGHCEPPGSRGGLRPAGGGPGGPMWSQGHLVWWRASPTGTGAGSSVSSAYTWLAPARR
jgi:hypothetical protein